MSQQETAASAKPAKLPKAKRQSSHRSTLSLQRTEIRINVYDLLPPGRLSSFLWLVGSSLLHSGVVLADREYAYGGHDQPSTSGVYWTRPGLEPPGGTFKLSVLHGFCLLSASEVDAVVREASERFMGTSYSLLTNNCNHFTSYLCERLTGKPAPAWLNRAASVGVALPCVVPREWIAPPDYETADGDLVGGDGVGEEDDDDDERAAMLTADRRRRDRDRRAADEQGSEAQGRQQRWEEEDAPDVLRDTDGRDIPAAERAPVPGGR